MEPRADDVLRKAEKDAPRPDAMLQEAEYLNQEGVGHRLNFMTSLYYEVSPENPDDAEETDGAGASR